MSKIKKDEELSIYVERMLRMIQILRIYEMVLKIPPEQDEVAPPCSMKNTMMAIVYSFYYSLIEDNPKGINFFKIWRDRTPNFKDEIDSLECKVKPFKDKLKIFRNRFGFHGSTSRKHEDAAFSLLRNHNGAEIYNVIIETRNLSTKLINFLTTSEQ